jgi:hypothetical protein
LRRLRRRKEERGQDRDADERPEGGGKGALEEGGSVLAPVGGDERPEAEGRARSKGTAAFLPEMAARRVRMESTGRGRGTRPGPRRDEAPGRRGAGALEGDGGVLARNGG